MSARFADRTREDIMETAITILVVIAAIVVGGAFLVMSYQLNREDRKGKLMSVLTAPLMIFRMLGEWLWNSFVTGSED